MILSYPGLFKNIPHVWFLRLYSLMKNLQHDFPKMRGGSKAVWNFSENSSVLEWGCFPYLSLYSRSRRCSYIAAQFHFIRPVTSLAGLQFFRFGEGSGLNAGNVLCSQTRELQQQCVRRPPRKTIVKKPQCTKSLGPNQPQNLKLRHCI